jgi:23S rRNA pseudouridine1911/1915/1917 synthase
MPPDLGPLQLIVAPAEAGIRLDLFLSQHLPDCSRSHAAHLIDQRCIQVDGALRKAGYRLKPGELVVAILPPPAPVAVVPEPIRFGIVYEDGDLIVVDKPAGLVVHPAAGHAAGTLVNGLLHHCRDLQGIGGEHRPGIVHRLDKDTSGLLVAAKNDRTHQGLSQQFKSRRVHKLYLALVWGEPEDESGAIDRPLGRHAVARKRMAVLAHGGREALTLWRVRERLPECALLAVELKTGRTHQIRVHCQSIGHPLVGDAVYGRRRSTARPGKGQGDALVLLGQARRQMLHAAELSFTHPSTDQRLCFQAPLPGDMAALLGALRELQHPGPD